MGRGTEPSPGEKAAEASRGVLSQQGSGSVNEALARGLRTRIVKDVAAAEAAMMRLSQSSLLQKARCMGDFLRREAKAEGAGGHFWHDAVTKPNIITPAP
jgi:hypothetical protein